jgi:hypothetical protein
VMAAGNTDDHDIQLRSAKPNPWAQLLEQALRMLGAARAEIASLRARLDAGEGER